MKVNSLFRTVKVGANTNIEALIIEFAVGVICFVMAFADWGNGKTIMFWPCIIVAGICFSLVGYTLFSLVLDKIRNR